MPGFNFPFRSAAPGSHISPVAGRVSPVARAVVFLSGVPFAAFGIFALWRGGKKLLAGEAVPGALICGFGLVFLGAGGYQIYTAVSAERRRRAAETKWRAQTGDGSKPWLFRPDWAAGRIKSSAQSQLAILGFMAAAFCGVGGFLVAYVLPQELHKGNQKVWLALIFPAAGLILLGAVIRGLLARRRFGDIYFEMAAVPGVLNGSLDGMIQTEKPVSFEHGLHLKLSCIRRVVTGSGKNRSTSETILWQDEKVFAPCAALPETAPGRSGIPVHFDLPADQPESFSRGNEAILWRLGARAKMAGPDYAATFDVPVFQVAGITDAPPAPDADPTRALQVSAAEVRREEHSRIQMTDGPGGREFYFPAARSWGVAGFMVFIGLAAAAGCAATVVKHVPILATAISGLFAVIFGWAGLNLLFKSSRVTVNQSGVTVRDRWLIFGRTRRFDAAQISRITFKAGMTAGTKAYQDLKLVLHDGASGVTLASALGSAIEARWLAEEMTRALGRKP